MYCLFVYLIQIQSYHAFSNMVVDHWCLSLSPRGHGQKSLKNVFPIWVKKKWNQLPAEFHDAPDKGRYKVHVNRWVTCKALCLNGSGAE